MVSLSVSTTIWSDGESKLKAGPAQEHGSEVIDLPGAFSMCWEVRRSNEYHLQCLDGFSSKSPGKWMFILQKAGIT